MKIENLSLKDIKPYAKNPRNNKDAVDFVANSIREFGVKQPIVIDADNVVVVGHTRLLAAKKLKMKEFPCVRAMDLSDEQIKAYRIADNSTGEVATWDDELLKLEVDGLPDFDFGEFGLSLCEKEMCALDDFSEKDISIFEIVVTCEDEVDLEKKYAQLTSMGLTCKISTL